MAVATAPRSPLYEAQNSSRYERQQLIRGYQDAYACRLVVIKDVLFSRSITLFEEALYDAKPSEDLHVLLSTPGGDGETALRLIRQAQSRCNELTVIVPDQAKSAGTLFALGADHIYMGPTSDLGPIDPQFMLSGSLAAGKAIIAAVEEAERRVQENPQTYPLHASLLGDITALMVQQARDALKRTDGQLREALACVTGRTDECVDEMASTLRGPLLDDSQSHGAAVPQSMPRTSVCQLTKRPQAMPAGRPFGGYGPSTSRSTPSSSTRDRQRHTSNSTSPRSTDVP